MRLSGVTFRYARRRPPVLSEVELELPPACLVRVSGINGAGKSTLLRLVAGARLPTSGEITGRPADVGFAPERLGPVRLSAEDFITRIALSRGHLPSAASAAVAALLDAFALPGDVRLDEASKGTLQKTNLVQALVLGRELLVLDEPFSGLDAAARAVLAETVATALRGGTRVVVADHGSTLLDLLPVAETWHVADGTVSVERLTVDDATSTTELTELRVTVETSKADATASLLRSLGLVVDDEPRA